MACPLAYCHLLGSAWRLGDYAFSPIRWSIRCTQYPIEADCKERDDVDAKESPGQASISACDQVNQAHTHTNEIGGEQNCNRHARADPSRDRCCVARGPCVGQSFVDGMNQSRAALQKCGKYHRLKQQMKSGLLETLQQYIRREGGLRDGWILCRHAQKHQHGG